MEAAPRTASPPLQGAGRTEAAFGIVSGGGEGRGSGNLLLLGWVSEGRDTGEMRSLLALLLV